MTPQPRTSSATEPARHNRVTLGYTMARRPNARFTYRPYSDECNAMHTPVPGFYGSNRKELVEESDKSRRRARRCFGDGQIAPEILASRDHHLECVGRKDRELD